jgi:RHS repeat-associated protein
VEDEILYDAFGNVVMRDLSTVGDYTVPTPTPFLWGGSHQYQADYESGLMLLGNRYYDPAIGRFISQDPAQDESNWYSYCGNNPLVAVDPSGLTEKKDQTALIVIADTKVGKMQGANDRAVQNLAKTAAGYYDAEGYGSVKIRTNPTEKQVDLALADKSVNALTWIGHEAFPGAVSVNPGKGGKGSDGMRGADFERALSGRKLDEARFFACHSNHNYELRDGIVGPGGHWTGADGFYQPVTGINSSIRGLKTLYEYERERAIMNGW